MRATGQKLSSIKQSQDNQLWLTRLPSCLLGNRCKSCTSPPNKGKLGTLLSLRNKEIFPGGYPVFAAEIQLQDGSITWVPAANLEIIQ